MPYYLNHPFRKNQIKGVLNRLENAMYTAVADLKVEAWTTREPVPFAKRRSGKKLTLSPGDKWGGLFDCAWFHFTGRVPASAAGRKVVMLIDVNGELCVVDACGVPARGLTSVKSSYDMSLGSPGKRALSFLNRARGGEKVDLWADAGCNDLFGKLLENGAFKEARIAICNEQLRGLFYDYEVLHNLMSLLPEDSARQQQILQALSDAANALRRYDESEAKAARAILAPQLAKGGGTPSFTLSAVGHAHIDLGWLWPIRETYRKGARTFSTVLELMERYPDYVFGASQAQLFQWMKDLYPELYRKIKRRVAEGRFEAQGGMWVEMDCNVPSGESMVRQFLYGKRFFRDEFGLDMKIMWEPDVFGYSGALPQIMKKSGVDYFMTQKLSWNKINVFPHHSFWWQGIDGTKVLAHMPPEDTYNSSAAPRALLKAEKNFKDKSLSDRGLMLFGIGDGGGGPGPEHLERLMRAKSLSGLPAVVQEPAARSFKRIEPQARPFKTWVGELYLEYHQGTYTSQARNKYYNRKMEFGLRELELMSCLAGLAAGAKYPQRELDAIWKEVLLYQFHDILPGSSIKRVYDESCARYAVLDEQTRQLTQKADAVFARQIDTSGARRPAVVFNSLSWDRAEWVKAGGKWRQVSVPGMGYATVELAGKAPAASGVLSASARKLENDILRVTFAKDGTLASVYDKPQRREVLSGGAGNLLTIYDDQGSAWDFSFTYADDQKWAFDLVSSEARVDGPRAIMRQSRAFGASTLTQEIILTQGSRRLDFVTQVDWHETHKMLRVSFPVAVQASEATCEIQFGAIRRPTHSNTTWDMAKFEICAQRWIDLSQRDYGVALLNNCKYGHRVHENVLDLNLLRSPQHPGVRADEGRHEFTYSLLPHEGDHVAGGVVRAGYELNVPLRVLAAPKRKGALPPSGSFIQCDAPNVIIDTVKKAQDGGDLIVRLYEAHGAAARAKVRFGFPIKSAQLANLMEEAGRKLKVSGNAIILEFRPFEVHTLRVSHE